MILGQFSELGIYGGVAIDATPPVITINPVQTSYVIEAGGVFTPPVATSTDETDGSKVLTPSGTVDTSAVGSYTLTYTDMDLAGNAASPVVVTVNVVDTVAPVITLSPNQTTYSIDVGDTFTFPIGTSTDVVGGVQTITPSGTVDTGTIGVYTLTYSSTDASGNAAVPIVVTVNVNEVLDVTAPIIMISGSETTTIELGETIPTFTASTDDGSPVTISGDTVDNRTVGTYVITFNSIDSSGNTALEVTRTINVNAGVMETLYQNTVGTTDTPDQIWQHSDNFWFVPKDNANTFIGAEYVISDTSGNVLLSADLGDHVVVIEGGFLIKISDILVTFTGTCYHQFVLTDSLGNKRPPEFFRKAFVNRISLNN
jgi:hypothetical protein